MVLIVIVIGIAVNRLEHDNPTLFNGAEEPDDPSPEPQPAPLYVGPQLAERLLKNIGCNPVKDDDGNLQFTYQGEEFTLISNDHSVWVKLIDNPWYSCPMDNLDEMSAMQRAIDSANIIEGATAVYQYNERDKLMFVYSQKLFALHSQMPQAAKYLCAHLDLMFQLKHCVIDEFGKEKRKIGIE